MMEIQGQGPLSPKDKDVYKQEFAKSVELFQNSLNEYEKAGVNHFHEGYVVTNTRFSNDAIAYANCRNLKLMSWDYPVGMSLRELIEKFKLHPITCLTSLTKKDKKDLLLAGVVSCADISKKTDILRKLKMNNDKIRNVINEAGAICP